MAKKMNIKKYEEGTKSVSSPKKNFISKFVDKQREKEKANHAELEALDAADGITSRKGNPNEPKKMNFISKAINKQREKEKANHIEMEALDKEIESASKAKSSNYTITNESSFVGPTKPATKDEELVKSTTPKIAKLDKAPTEEMRKVMEWQKKRGLKADGIWGEKTKAAYEKEQAAKKSTPSTPKKMDLTKPKDTKYDLDLSEAPKGTTAQSQETHGDLEDTMGRRSAAGKMYKSYNERNSAYDKGYNSVERPKNLLESTKNYPTVKGESYAKPKVDPYNESRVQEYLNPDPELRGSRVNSREAAQKLANIDKEGESKAMSTALKVGVPAAVVGAAATAYGIKKGKMKANTSKAVGNAAKDFAAEMSGSTANKSKTMNLPKPAAEVKSEPAKSAPQAATNSSTVEDQARRARAAQAKQKQAAALAGKKNSVKSSGPYMTDEQRAEFKANLKAKEAATAPKKVEGPTTKTVNSPTAKTVKAPETKAFTSGGFESKVTGDKFKSKKK